jgi:hypothetical protein
MADVAGSRSYGLGNFRPLLPARVSRPTHNALPGRLLRLEQTLNEVTRTGLRQSIDPLSNPGIGVCKKAGNRVECA